MDESPRVQLWSATLPSALRVIAVHTWFNAYDEAEGRWRRWEVWQNRDAGGESWGHVHRDLMHPERPVGGGPAQFEREWMGDEAERLLQVLAASPDYPERHRYRYWPGPNSNTYAAWVLAQAGIEYVLDPRAVGKDYLGALGCGIRRGEGRLRLESPLLGLHAQPGRAFELHVLGLTLGFEREPFALTTPVGRFRIRRRSALPDAGGSALPGWPHTLPDAFPTPSAAPDPAPDGSARSQTSCAGSAARAA